MVHKDTGIMSPNGSNKVLRVLFVCTGNTCRSPMAQTVFNLKAKELGISAAAFSRGLFADGSAISKNAVKALEESSYEPDSHISSTVTYEDMRDGDLIIGISKRHAAQLAAAFPEYKDKIRSFPTDISDPFGGDVEVYKAALSDIIEGMDEILEYVKQMSAEDNIGENEKNHGIVIERLSKAHIDGMENIENKCFSEPWSKKALEELLTNEYAVYFVAKDLESSEVAGYCGMYVSLDTGAINNIGVLPEYRRCGIGSRLLESIIDYSQNNGITLLTLEVRESNTGAKALYEKFGFTEVGTRKNYYRKPTEHAILYNKQII